MQKAGRRLSIILFCICIAALLTGAGFWYYRQINDKIYQSMIDNTQELAEHDLNVIRTNVERN